MIDLVLIALGTAIALYVILGGADFGAGIVESFLGLDEDSSEYHVISHAIGPVWEANHIWSILAIVILFIAFPTVFSEISISFHIPLLVMLIGITLRGCAFAFRHYDVGAPDPIPYYAFVYRAGSWITPFAQGVVAGGTLLGRVNPHATSFYDRFINPWCNFFSFSVGIFFCCICAFLASAFLIGDTEKGSLRERFRTRARSWLWAVAVSGTAVFVSADLSGLDLLPTFIGHPVGLSSLIFALLIAVIIVFFRLPVLITRASAATFAVAIVTGWLAIQYPDLIMTSPESGVVFNVYEVAAPSPVLWQLLLALGVGAGLIVPSLGYLFWVFKLEEV